MGLKLAHSLQQAKSSQSQAVLMKTLRCISSSEALCRQIITGFEICIRLRRMSAKWVLGDTLYAISKIMPQFDGIQLSLVVELLWNIFSSTNRRLAADKLNYQVRIN
jgi:hypothetical protein